MRKIMFIWNGDKYRIIYVEGFNINFRVYLVIFYLKLTLNSFYYFFIIEIIVYNFQLEKLCSSKIIYANFLVETTKNMIEQ